MTRVALSTLVFGLVAVPVRAEEKPADAIAALRGSWVCIEQAGKKPTRDIRLVVDKAGGYKIGGTGGESSDLATLGGVEGTIRIDPAKGQIDLVGSKLTLPGIYKLVGDRLSLLIGPTGARPTSFDKLDGTFHVFIREAEKK
jgi:hypothetical protein